MFDFVHEKKRFVQIMLVLIAVTFAFFGLDTFNQVNKADVVATVNGEKITQQAFEQDLRQQQERMRESMQGNFDSAMLDNPEAKRMVLNNLIDQRLLMMQARAVDLRVSDKQLAETIAGIPAFQKEGRFDKTLYTSILTRQGRAIPAFEAEMAHDLNMRQLIGTYLHNGYASAVTAEKIIRLNGQQRVVAIAHIPLNSFLTKVKVTDVDVRKYYELNAHEYKVDEQLRVEYVTFSATDLQSQISVTEEEVKKYYDEQTAEFGTQEQRHVAHILISAAAQASGAEKEAAQLKAENILQQVKQSPQAFANLAKQHSQDSGSAAVGGDLGMVARGVMVLPAS
jgi:peptidyl-prolyl cis-trans isomerase D